jgi:5'-methylthioadenosine phosphorylase
MQKAQIGIIGGSGLYNIEGIKNIKSVNVTTPFGRPSSKYIIGQLGQRTVAFLPRHDVGHRLLPSELNYRANIFGFKKLGVEQIIAISAVGSLKEEIAPLDIVIPHQFFDRTTHRHQTFFGEGVVAHIPFAHPICMDLAEVLHKAAKKTEINIHWGGTYLNMEGPAFSTKAESEVYRQWGMDIIGMTNLAEAKLAREAEICYATIALVTDYDCWHPSHETVTVDMVVKNLLKNVTNAKKILELALPHIPLERKCKCKDALKYAFATDKKIIPEKIRKKLNLIIGKHISPHEANYF